MAVLKKRFFFKLKLFDFARVFQNQNYPLRIIANSKLFFFYLFHNTFLNFFIGIDYWLNNLMCNVPEILMCYHLDGLVQNYEIIKTEDLPYLENSQFSPNVIRNVAQNILSFLKQNATVSGHTNSQ